jgi:hypothetical protein
LAAEEALEIFASTVEVPSLTCSAYIFEQDWEGTGTQFSDLTGGWKHMHEKLVVFGENSRHKMWSE